MTGSAPGERAEAEPSAVARLRDAALPLGIILALGIALRFIIAYALFPGSGLGFDVGSFNAWASNIASDGPWRMYDRGFFLDYTPGYLYVLWALGAISGVLGGPDAAPGDFLKVPPMLADAGLAVMVFILVADLGGSRRRALLAAALVMAVPVTWIDSAIWSQVDAVGTLVLLLAVWRLGRGHHVSGTVLTTIAAIIKPQFGILVPLAAVLIIRRELARAREEDRPGFNDDPILWAIRAVGILCFTLSVVLAIPHLMGVKLPEELGAADYLSLLLGLGVTAAALALRLRDRTLGSGVGRLVSIGIVGLGTAAAFAAPFAVNVAQLAVKIGQTAANYHWITVNAYNPWALLSRDGSGLASGGGWLPDVTTEEHGPAIELLGIPALYVGTGLLLLAIAAMAVVVWRRPDRRTLVTALAVMAIAFFVLPTRVHERYMFPFFALGAVLAVRSWRWFATYLVLAAATSMNLLGVLAIYRTTDNGTLGLDGFFNAFDGAGGRLAEAVSSGPGIMLAAILVTGGLIAAVIFLLRPGDEVEEAWEEPFDEYERAAPGTYLAEGDDDIGGDDGGGATYAARGAWLRRAWHDRTSHLAAEPGGRFDRLDIWLLVVLVVASLSLRTFRLGEPLEMHFDEVYHARTATEFLQDWRYGQPHSIYEYTHPHLAKYAIAGGLVAFGNDRVEETSNLGAAARGAAVEARWDDGLGRGGERLYVATGSQLRAYDLISRSLLFAAEIPGASAVAVDEIGRRVFVGTDGGALLTLSTDIPTADFADAELSADRRVPTAYGNAGGAVTRLWVIGDGTTLLGTLADGTLASWDTTGDQATLLGSSFAAGIEDLVDLGTLPALVATPSAVPDKTGAGAVLVGALGGSAQVWEQVLTSGSDPDAQITISLQAGAYREDLKKLIDAGSLPGFELKDMPAALAADPLGVVFIDPTSGRTAGRIAIEGGATGLAWVPTGGPKNVYVTGGTLSILRIGSSGEGTARVDGTIWMPGPVSKVVFNGTSGLAHVLGKTPDGSASTIYVVEPNGQAVFADARLPFDPAILVTDVQDHDPLTERTAQNLQEQYPSDDRQQILAFAGDGRAASVSVGQHAFAWRIMGVIAGAFLVGFLFLLARILFRRRSIGILAGIFSLLDGMFFVQSRIAMNDVYLGVFMLAGITLFAAIWTGAWKGRLALWLGLPLVGVLMGLALASKWVALYAIGALGVLILIRSALGRIVVILGLGAATGVLGYMALSLPPEGATSGGNAIFVLILMGLTILAAVLAILHPIAWTPDEVRIAVALPVAAGIAVGLIALAMPGAAAGAATTITDSDPKRLAAYGAVALFGVAAVALFGFWLGGKIGLGPMAPPVREEDPASILPPPSDAPDGWLLPGRWGGASIVWAAFALLAIPVAVYVLSYLPWVGLGNRLTEGWPAGNTGQTFIDLTKSMYDYHNNLREGHAASSPWWAWVFNLKPVWFYQGQMAGDVSGAIYDGGNIALWWMSIPAMAFVAFQAFRRRSNQLALVAVVIACMWLAWARIDRATFEYHYFSTLPFVLLALAYFIAEIWHGPSARTFLLAKVGAAIALLGPVILWLGKGPLCAIAGVSKAVKNSNACGGGAQISISPSVQVLGLIVVLLVGGGLVVALMLRLDGALRRGEPTEETARMKRLIVGVAIGAVIAFAGAFLFLPQDPLFADSRIPGELMALVLLVVLGPLAWLAATAKSPRRFVIGYGAAVLLVAFAFYPNWSGLPLPDAFFNYYQGVTPTWIYDFQFAVNTNEPFPLSLRTWEPFLLAGVTLFVAALLAWVAWTWRISLAERAADEATFYDEA